MRKLQPAIRYELYCCNAYQLYGPNDNFDLERSHVLPAMIRKIHLAHCLKQGDWDAIRKDLDLRPVEGIDGTDSKEDIPTILAKYGISDNEVNLGTGTPLREFLGAKKWQMPVYSSWNM